MQLVLYGTMTTTVSIARQFNLQPITVGCWVHCRTDLPEVYTDDGC